MLKKIYSVFKAAPAVSGFWFNSNTKDFFKLKPFNIIANFFQIVHKNAKKQIFSTKLLKFLIKKAF